MSEPKRILWVDDEIGGLTSHILFLEHRLRRSDRPQRSGRPRDAERKRRDIVLLDEQMPGMWNDGLRADPRSPPAVAGRHGHEERGGRAHGPGDRRGVSTTTSSSRSTSTRCSRSSSGCSKDLRSDTRRRAGIQPSLSRARGGAEEPRLVGRLGRAVPRAPVVGDAAHRGRRAGCSRVSARS